MRPQRVKQNTPSGSRVWLMYITKSRDTFVQLVKLGIRREYDNECIQETGKYYFELPSLQSCSVFPLPIVRACVHLQMPQTSNRRVIRPRLAINEERHMRVKGPVLGRTPSGILDRAEVKERSGVEDVWVVRSFWAPGERDVVVTRF